MKRFPINKYVFILFCVLFLAGRTIAVESFKNTLLKTDIYKSSSGGIKINLYTSKPYADSVVVNKINDNEYVILLPETSNSITLKPSLDKFSDVIKDISIKTQTYENQFKGYTKITILTQKPLEITSQIQVLKPVIPASNKKDEKTVQITKAQNAVAKKDTRTPQTANKEAKKSVQSSKTVQKNPAHTASVKKAAQSPVIKTEKKPFAYNHSALIQKAEAKQPQATLKKVAQKPISKPKSVTKKATVPKPSAKPQTEQKQVAHKVSATAAASTPKKVVAKTPAVPAPKTQPIKAPTAPIATPPVKTPLPAVPPKQEPNVTPPVPAATQPPMQTPPPAAPPVNNATTGFASFFNLYTFGGSVIGMLLFLLFILRIRRNARPNLNNMATEPPNDYTQYQDNSDNIDDASYSSQETEDVLLDSGGSLFSVANGAGGVNDSLLTEESTLDSDFGANDFSFDEEASREAMSDVYQEVDDLLASEEVMPEYALNDTADGDTEIEEGQEPVVETEFDSPENLEYDVDNEEVNSLAFEEEESNSNDGFEMNDLTSDEENSPDTDIEVNAFSPQTDFEQAPRRVPTIPTIPTERTASEMEEIDDLLDNAAGEETFAGINDSAFVQEPSPTPEENTHIEEDEMSLDKLNELENQNIETEEPSIEDLFAEEVVNEGVNESASQGEINTSQAAVYETLEEPEIALNEQDLEDEIRIVEPFNQKFDESQIEKIKMPDKFEEANKIPLPENNYSDTIEEINFEPLPELKNSDNDTLQTFDDFETVAEPEEVVKSEFEINDESGFYLVDYLDYSILVGHIGEEIFILKRFDEKVDDKLQARLNEKKGTVSNYMIKVGGFKALVEVSPLNMNLLIEL